MTIEKRGQVLNLDVRNKNVNKQDLTPGRFLGDYVYNAKGQRVKKAVNEQTTIYNYDRNGLLMMESTGSGTITAEYVYLNGQPLAKIESNNVYYYHIDHLGTPMMMTDSSGNTVWQGEFKPFGEPVSVNGSITNNLRFPGQYYDEETGLHQNWHRDYTAEVGRYVETDPVGIIRGENHLYVYVQNNPINFFDPWGLAKGDWWDPRTYLPDPPPPGPPGSGCGDEKTDCIVPDLYPEACKAHDKCYASQGRTQAQCDNQIWVDIFNESGPWPNVIDPTLYWLGVRLFGNDAYNRAQGK